MTAWLLALVAAATPLDAAQVIALVRERSPTLRVLRARLGESGAARVVAGAWAQSNPELTALGGARFYVNSARIFPYTKPTLEVLVGLSWPFDLSGAPRARAALADQRSAVAEVRVAASEQTLIHDALVTWIMARTARARLALEQQRAALDDDVVRIARVRRSAGTVGDADVALAQVLYAEGRARLSSAGAEKDASLLELCWQLGIDDQEPLSLPELGATSELAALAALISGLDQHPALVRAAQEVAAAKLDVEVQSRAAIPSPRLMTAFEHAPEYAVHSGVGMALPVYQRNQTNVAVTRAHVATALAEQKALRSRIEADLRAAHARAIGAEQALASLDHATAAIDDTEHLAKRSYELGQAMLSEVVTASREAALARLSLLEARASRERAAVAVKLAAGVLQ